MPVSLIRSSICRSAHAATRWIRPLRLGVLRGVRQHVDEDLGQPRGVATHHQSGACDVDGDLMLAFLEQRAGRLDGRGHDVGDLDRVLPQIDLAARDA